MASAQRLGETSGLRWDEIDLDKIAMVGQTGSSLYLLDQELGRRAE
jgi:integrase